MNIALCPIPLLISPLKGEKVKIPPLQGEDRWGWVYLIAAGGRALL